MLLCTACGSAFAQTAEELLADGKNTENVTTFGMGYDLKMYSPLKQINKSNVKRLVPVWSFSLANDMGELSQPTIYDGVMYVVNGNWTFAIDVATGRQIWRTPVDFDRAALRVATGGAIMRGPATIYQGEALSADAGRACRRARHENRQGDLATKVRRIQGRLQGRYRAYHRQRRTGVRNGRRRSTTRGFIEGYDPDTGNRLWRKWTIPAPGEPGSETWPHATSPKPGSMAGCNLAICFL